MKTNKFEWKLSMCRVRGWFAIHVPSDWPNASAWRFVWKATYHLACEFWNCSYLEYGGTIPLDVPPSASESGVVRATGLCLELASHMLNELDLSHFSPPPAGAFDVPLSTLVSAAFRGVPVVREHSFLATLLLPHAARPPSDPAWLRSHSAEKLKATSREQGYAGPFWDEVVKTVAELAGAKKESA